MPATTIGVLGCGNMGGGMAARLAACDQAVLCYDADAVLLEQLAASGLSTVASAARLAAECDLIILSLPKAAVVQSVMQSMAELIRPGTIILDTSTSEPETTRYWAKQATDKGFHFLDTPVSGGPLAARNGSMTMLIGGDPAVADRIKDTLDLLSAKRVAVGPAGAGHAAKIVNNLLCAANLVLLAEALRLGEAAGVRAGDLLDGINAGSGRSGVSEVNYPKWILNETFDSGFTMGLMRKDVALATDLAQRLGVSLPAFAPITDRWASSARELDDAEDFNAITRWV